MPHYCRLALLLACGIFGGDATTACTSTRGDITNSWCTSTCNHVPPNCPSFCVCGGTAVTPGATPLVAPSSSPAPSGPGSCVALASPATVEWCIQNCYHVPSNCPADLCRCNPAPPVVPTPIPNTDRDVVVPILKSYFDLITTGSCTQFAALFAQQFVIEHPFGSPVATTVSQAVAWCNSQRQFGKPETFSIEHARTVPAASNWLSVVATSYFKTELRPDSTGSGCLIRNLNQQLIHFDGSYKITSVKTFFGVEDPTEIYINPSNPQCIANLQLSVPSDE